MKNKIDFNGIKDKFFYGKIYFWIGGLVAFLWVVLRSGINPKRLAYPCQQAAFPLASAWVIAIIAIFSGTLLLKYFTRLTLVSCLIVGSVWGYMSFTNKQKSALAITRPPVWQASNPISKIFVLDKIPTTAGSVTAGDATVPDANLSDPAIDTLVMLMDAQGLYLLKTTTHPGGIIGSDETVIIKGNFQWASYLGTNTDRIKGLIWHILNHPQGFTGEILVCDNAQGANGTWTNCNNSDDATQTIADVTNTFKAKGYPVDLVRWDNIMGTTVTEYSAGNMTSGFTFNATTKVTYPKFQTPKGTYASMRYGIWNTVTSTYDRNKLCIINMPVCKAHGYAGATLAIKNWVGMMSLTDKAGRYVSEDNMHLEYFLKAWALPARVMAEVTPDLNIIDATWTATQNNYTVGQTMANTKTIIASTDPVAISWYAAKFVLLPVAAYPNSVNPDRVYTSTPGLWDCPYTYAFKNWANFLINTAQLSFTRDSSKISVYNRSVLLQTPSLPIQNSEVKLYPNPARGFVKIESGKQNVVEYYNIISLDGKVLQSGFVKNNEINTDKLLNGNYIVQLNDKNKKLVGNYKVLIAK